MSGFLTTWGESYPGNSVVEGPTPTTAVGVRAARRRGFTLEVRASNDAALQLYETMGFRRQGVRRGYYTDNREDAVIMWRDASAGDGS